MLSKVRIRLMSKSVGKLFSLALLVVLALPAGLRAQRSEEHDDYKLKLDGFWFYSNPSGIFHGQSDTVPVDFTKDLGFSSYSTFAGKVDWKFTHKNHFYVVISPFYTARQATLTRDITFEGLFFPAGTSVNAYLHAFLVAPGYDRDADISVWAYRIFLIPRQG